MGKITEKKFLDIKISWKDEIGWSPESVKEALGEFTGGGSEVTVTPLPSPEPEKWCECKRELKPGYWFAVKGFKNGNAICKDCNKPIKPPEKKELPERIKEGYSDAYSKIQVLKETVNKLIDIIREMREGK